MNAQDEREREQPRRLRPWVGDVAVAAIGNALGTLTAALILFLGAVALGAIDDIPTRSIVGAALILVSLILGAVSSLRLKQLWPRYVESRQRLADVERPVRRAQAAFGRARNAVPDRDASEAKFSSARRAFREGDYETADRLLDELERDVANAHFAVDESERYVREAEAAFERGEQKPAG